MTVREEAPRLLFERLSYILYPKSVAPRLGSSMMHLEDSLKAITFAKNPPPLWNFRSKLEIRHDLLYTSFKLREIRWVGCAQRVQSVRQPRGNMQVCESHVISNGVRKKSGVRACSSRLRTSCISPEYPRKLWYDRHLAIRSMNCEGHHFR